jgi:hypothetical protein
LGLDVDWTLVAQSLPKLLTPWAFNRCLQNQNDESIVFRFPPDCVFLNRFFLFFNIVLGGGHCGIYKSSYNVSDLSLLVPWADVSWDFNLSISKMRLLFGYIE